MYAVRLALAILALVGCTAVQCPTSTSDVHARCDHGVPNLAAVEEGRLYRGGQPTLAGWQYLHDVLHVTTVVKLNGPGESYGQGEDEPATALGMEVRVHTIHPIDGDDPLELLRGPTLGQIHDTLAAMTEADGPVYFHCHAGRDRTGLMAAVWRVAVDDWSPARAHDEMMAMGFRTINLGLDASWHRWVEARR